MFRFFKVKPRECKTIRLRSTGGGCESVMTLNHAGSLQRDDLANPQQGSRTKTVRKFLYFVTF